MRKIGWLGLGVLLSLWVGIFPLAPTVAANAYLTPEEYKLLNDSPNWVANDCNISATVGDAGLTGSNNEEKSWNYFIGKGLTPAAVAGIMGNISQESGFDPTQIEIPPGGNTNDPSSISTGWGLIQFTPGNGVYDWAKAAKVQATKDNIYLLSTQLDIVWGYMQNSTAPDGKNMLDEFKAQSTDPHAATDSFEKLVENAGTPDMTNRYAAAYAAFTKYGQGGAAGTPAPTGSAPSGGSCSCPSGGSAAGANGSTIVLDPGHSTFSDTSSRNALTGLYDTDTTGGPNEMHDAWVAANKIKPLLESKGYTVKLTKNSEDESINLSQRAERANSDNAALLFTIHADSSVRWLAYPDNNSIRMPGNSPRRDGTNGLVHPDIINSSKTFAEKMAPIIAKGISQGGDAYDATSFAGYYGQDGLTGNGLNRGNTPVQTILSSVPEVYSEVSPTDLPSDAFAQAVTNAISAVVQPSGNPAAGATGSGGSVSGCYGGAVSGNLIATVKNYAWPDYHDAPYLTMEPAYRDAVRKAQSQGRYVGGLNYPGIDCGGFVTLAMVDSGYEPGYNFGGKGGFTGTSPSDPGTQWNWLSTHWQKINPQGTQDLHPGDVAINSDHTYIYVGKVPGFNSLVASASLDQRAPMAGHETPADPAFNWYRKK